MTYLLVVLIIVSMTYNFYLHRKYRDLKEDLRYVHRSHRVAIDQLAEKCDALVMRGAKQPSPSNQSHGGGSWFSPYMTIQDALNLHPGVKDALAELHIGGCSSCSVSSRETLEQAAAGHRVDLEEMLTKLNALMDGASPASTVEAPDELTSAEKHLPPANGGRIMLAVGKAPERQPQASAEKSGES